MEFKVFIKKVQGEKGRARLIKGYINLNGEIYDFKAIAIDTHGGPSLGAHWTKNSLAKLKKKLSKEEIDNLLIELQQRLILGQVNFESK
ncbi:hypothetical protein HRbin06_00059 [archaeon HR06]|nr:hypothetical protein HRbin06_00059 [archaeon HR06]